MPRFQVWSMTTSYDRHVIEAEDERDAFWALMLDEPEPAKHVELQEVYRVAPAD